MIRRFSTLIVVIMVALMLASTVSAQRRVSRKNRTNIMQQKLAISLNLGGAIPTGDFTDRDLGNHNTGANVAFEGEYYFDRSFSLGLSVQGGLFEDKTFPEIETNVTTVGAYLRYVAATKGKVRPFFRFGLTLTQLEFKNIPIPFGLNQVDLESESKVGIFTGVGFIAMVSRKISVNGEVGYNFTNTEETEIKPNPWFEPLVVGFKTSYVTISGGISYYIPM